MAGVGHAPRRDIGFLFDFIGEDHKSTVVDLLGAGWDWEGRRVLDFGCGPGRLLRHLLPEARVAEVHGCDISEEMVSWVSDHLCPPVASVRVNRPRPPLDYPDDHFDLVTALSVFTHIAAGWSDWLLEMHRIVKPSGALIATFLDSSRAGSLTSVPWDEERVGMSVCGFADPEMSWPNVLHSGWWLREHWGRAFEIERLVGGSDLLDDRGRTAPTQGWMVLRPRPVELTPPDLEREDPEDERYLQARRYQLDLLRAEGEELKRRHERLTSSASWRLTAPLRRAKGLLGARPD
jgi:ubiquinone/menaquinone biosynthesis C-methylase UbiE